MDPRTIQAGKFLSYVLRHKPEVIGLRLDDQGWALVDDLVTLTAGQDLPLSRELIEAVVASSDKQRFSISLDGLRIRANQGHSLRVDLGLQPIRPPETLFHGTATRFFRTIRSAGLQPQARQHVHLSPGAETATQVGQRHGKPVVLEVRAAALFDAGTPFYLSENGVWLTPAVPPEYLIFPPSNEEIEMRWVNAWSDLLEVVGKRHGVKCLLPDGSVVDVEECKGWLQESVYEGCLVSVAPGWVLGREGVVVSRQRGQAR